MPTVARWYVRELKTDRELGGGVEAHGTEGGYGLRTRAEKSLPAKSSWSALKIGYDWCAATKLS